MKYALLASLLLSSTAFASTGSLWCSLSYFGTPTETTQAMGLSYRDVQIDQMSASTIQLTIDDHYYARGEVFQVTLVRDSGKKISGLAMGTYDGKREIGIKVEAGRILVTDDSMTYNCEIPGDYQKDYSAYVR